MHVELFMNPTNKQNRIQRKNCIFRLWMEFRVQMSLSFVKG